MKLFVDFYSALNISNSMKREISLRRLRNK